MKLSAKEYAKSLINQSGKDDAKKDLSNAIYELSRDGYAYSNKNQIRFFVTALFYMDKL